MKNKNSKKKTVTPQLTLVEEAYKYAKELNPIASYRTDKNNYEHLECYPKNEFAEKITVRASPTLDRRLQIEMFRTTGGNTVVTIQLISSSVGTSNAALRIIKAELKRFC